MITTTTIKRIKMMITVGRNLRCAVAFVRVEPDKRNHFVPKVPFPPTLSQAEGECRVRDTSVVSFPAARWLVVPRRHLAALRSTVLVVSNSLRFHSESKFHLPLAYANHYLRLLEKKTRDDSRPTRRPIR